MGNFNFIGQYDYVMDDKHRLNIPSKFRKQLEADSDDKLILSYGIDKCIHVFPYPLWEREVEMMNNLDQNKIDNRRYIRVMTSSAAEAQLDKQGRIIVPLHLREYADLSKDVKIVGYLDKIELWNPEDFNNQATVSIQDLNSLAEKLTNKDV